MILINLQLCKGWPCGTDQGITIEIDGKTTGLTKALKAANSEIKTTKSQLNSVEKALKLDPKNVDLLKAKQNALNGVIKETKKNSIWRSRLPNPQKGT